MDTAVRHQEASLLTDPVKEHKIDYAANEQSKTIITSYLVGDVQTQLKPTSQGSLRKWTNLEMNILDIPLWQLMGSKEYRNSLGINITKPKIADYAWCRLKGFELVFKDVSLSTLNTNKDQNSYQTIHDPIIQIRKRARGIDSTFISKDWEGVAGFYDEDYGDSINITNGMGSLKFNVGGNYVRTPKNILKNVVDINSLKEAYLPMRLGDLLLPVICPSSLIYYNTKQITDYETGNIRSIKKYNRLPYDGVGLNPNNYYQNIYNRRAPFFVGHEGTFESMMDVTNYGANMQMRMGQWGSDTIDYALDIRVRNLPQINTLTKDIVWLINYGIEIKATWECKLYEPINLKADILVIPSSTLKRLSSDRERWGWLNKIIKLAANAFIDWLVPIKLEDENESSNELRKLEIPPDITEDD